MDIPKINLDFREKTLGLVFGVLSENLQEPVASPDVQELQASTAASLKSSGLFSARPLPGHVEAPRVGYWKTLALSAKLGQVGFVVSRGTGVTPKTGESTLLTSFTLQSLSAAFSMYNNGAMDLEFSLKEIFLEDLRVNTKNQYRRVCSFFFRILIW